MILDVVPTLNDVVGGRVGVSRERVLALLEHEGAFAWFLRTQDRFALMKSRQSESMVKRNHCRKMKLLVTSSDKMPEKGHTKRYRSLVRLFY